MKTRSSFLTAVGAIPSICVAQGPTLSEEVKKVSTSIKVIPITFTEFVGLGVEPFTHKPKRFKIDSAIVTEALNEFRGAFKVLQAPREVLAICKAPSDAFNPVLFEKKPPVHKRQPFNPTLKSQKRSKGSFGGSHFKPGGSHHVPHHG